MKIHEYQGKALLKEFNIPIQDGFLLEDVKDTKEIVKKTQKTFNSEAVIVKAQIHAGGRGKAGGVKYCSSANIAEETAIDLMGKTLVTHQTGPEGKEVKKIFITEALDIEKEYYIAITLDRSKEKDVIMVSPEGGVDIEKVAEETPEKIFKVWIEPNYGLRTFQIQELVTGLGLDKSFHKEAIQFFKNLYKCYEDLDCTILEVNPLVLTEDSKIIALDSKLNFDDNALYKHPEIANMRDPDEEDLTELEASKYGLNYIRFNRYNTIK